MIVIDGSYGEGGGQILRIATALSAILGKLIRVTNIRSNRPKPGLMAQHLLGIRMAAEVCNGQLTGAEQGSREVELKPNNIQAGRFSGETGTAG